eukprot:scaffold3075_cov116-Skeletonema_menzelii.AAC.2
MLFSRIESDNQHHHRHLNIVFLIYFSASLYVHNFDYVNIIGYIGRFGVDISSLHRHPSIYWHVSRNSGARF